MKMAAYNVVSALVEPFRLLRGPAGLIRWFRDLRAYQRIPGAEPIRWRDINPQVHDRVDTSPYDAHYFFQDVWAARRIAELSPSRHVDVGSRVDLVGFVT